MPKKKVIKTELYQIRFTPSEKLMLQQAAEVSGLGTAEYFGSVLKAVSYCLLKLEPGERLSQEKLEEMLGAAVSGVVWPGLQKPAEQVKNEKGD